jgi:hypothetical protein
MLKCIYDALRPAAAADACQSSCLVGNSRSDSGDEHQFTPLPLWEGDGAIFRRGLTSLPPPGSVCTRRRHRHGCPRRRPLAGRPNDRTTDQPPERQPGR